MVKLVTGNGQESKHVSARKAQNVKTIRLNRSPNVPDENRSRRTRKMLLLLAKRTDKGRAAFRRYQGTSSRPLRTSLLTSLFSFSTHKSTDPQLPSICIYAHKLIYTVRVVYQYHGNVFSIDTLSIVIGLFEQFVHH